MSEYIMKHEPPHYGPLTTAESVNLEYKYLTVTDCLDLQQVVRCRDCEHYDPHCTDDGVCFLPDVDGDFARWEVKPDGFCAWGERRQP